MASGARLALEFDKSIAGGIKCFKGRMKEVNEHIIKQNEHSEEMEKEIISLKKGYVIAVQSQQSMRDQICDNEDRLMRIDEKNNNMEKRVYEKEELVRESNTFTPNPSIKEVVHVNIELHMKRQLLQQNDEKFKNAKQRKLDLERKTELTACKLQAVTSKLRYLTTELHHANLKLQRRNEDRSKIEELADSSEYVVMKECIKSDTSRLVEAKQRVKTLLERIECTEDEILTINTNRLKIEGTIINILRKIQEQKEKHRIFDIHYTLNKDSFIS